MENINSIGPVISTGIGFLSWGISKFLRENKVRKTASDVLEHGDSYNFQTDVKFWTKLLNVVAPAFLGILTGIGAIAAELSGNTDLALGLAGFAIPHLAEIYFNKKVRDGKDNSRFSSF